MTKRGLRTAAFSCALGSLAGCKENLQPPAAGPGPDTQGPLVQLAPGHDTTVDSTGTLQVRVNASDPSGVKSVDFFLIPPAFSFPTLTPGDTLFGASYPIALGTFKHSTFKYYVSSKDILDNATVTDTVTVTVR